MRKNFAETGAVTINTTTAAVKRAASFTAGAKVTDLQTLAEHEEWTRANNGATWGAELMVTETVGNILALHKASWSWHVEFPVGEDVLVDWHTGRFSVGDGSDYRYPILGTCDELVVMRYWDRGVLPNEPTTLVTRAYVSKGTFTPPIIEKPRREHQPKPFGTPLRGLLMQVVPEFF